MLRWLSLILVAVLCLAVGVGPATASPILVNGSFESGPAMNGPLCPISPSSCEDVDVFAGSLVIPGWEVFGVSIDYLGPDWDVADGIHAIDLDGRDAFLSGVRQTFATNIGELYDVAFALSGNPQGGPSVKNVRVAVGGTRKTTPLIRPGLPLTLSCGSHSRSHFSRLARAPRCRS